jgi:anaerobic ribonucleoside-triphosphate reductase
VKTIKKIPVETYSRVVGYFRPVSQWNKGKQEEFRERKTYNLDKIKGAVYEKTD